MLEKLVGFYEKWEERLEKRQRDKYPSILYRSQDKFIRILTKRKYKMYSDSQDEGLITIVNNMLSEYVTPHVRININSNKLRALAVSGFPGYVIAKYVLGINPNPTDYLLAVSGVGVLDYLYSRYEYKKMEKDANRIMKHLNEIEAELEER